MNVNKLTRHTQTVGLGVREREDDPLPRKH